MNDTPSRSSSVWSAWDEHLENKHRFRTWCGLAILLGWIGYAPMWLTHFFADDVDFFGGMCRALNQGTLVEYLFHPGNQHVSTLPKLGHFIVWKWLGRDVFWWQLMTLTCWTGAMVVLADWFQRIFKSRAIAVFLLALFSCSYAYRSQIMTPASANHLWSSCAATVSMWATWRYLHRGSTGFLVFSLVAAFASYLCVATGFLTFVFLIAMAGLARSDNRNRRLFLAGFSIVGGLAVVVIQKSVGGAGPKPDLLFGLKETGTALWLLGGRSFWGSDLSHAFSLTMLGLIAARGRDLSGRHLLFGGLLIVAPLLFATTFRSAFPGIGASSRYAFISMVGVCLLSGQGLEAARNLRRPSWLTARLAFLLLAGGFACRAAHAIPKNLMLMAQHTDELADLESRLGLVVAHYAASETEGPVGIPNHEINLPVSPERRPLDYIARYCAPADLAPRIIGVDRNDAFDDFVKRHDRRLWCQLNARMPCDKAYR